MSLVSSMGSSHDTTCYRQWKKFPFVSPLAFSLLFCRHFSEIGIRPDVIERPDALYVTGIVHLGGALIDWQVETDLVLFAEEYDPVDECLICMTKPASISVADLVDFMTRSLFCPATDGDADSYDRQLQWFTDEAEDTAIAYLETMDAVHQHQVRRVRRLVRKYRVERSSDGPSPFDL